LDLVLEHGAARRGAAGVGVVEPDLGFAPTVTPQHLPMTVHNISEDIR
jgi:hypothetical protein